jgi:hypothetical protein
VKSFLNQQKQKMNNIDSTNISNNAQHKPKFNTKNETLNCIQNDTQNGMKNDIKDDSENLNLYERNFPPKIKDVDVYKASDLQIYEEPLLCTKFGEKAGKWLYRCSYVYVCMHLCM